jgi:hypothetical protein
MVNLVLEYCSTLYYRGTTAVVVHAALLCTILNLVPRYLGVHSCRSTAEQVANNKSVDIESPVRLYDLTTAVGSYSGRS